MEKCWTPYFRPKTDFWATTIVIILPVLSSLIFQGKSYLEYLNPMITVLSNPVSCTRDVFQGCQPGYLQTTKLLVTTNSLGMLLWASPEASAITNTSSPGWKVWFYKYTHIELLNHNTTDGNKLSRASTNPVLQVMKQRPQKALVAVTHTWLGFFLVKCTCHQFTPLLPSRGHVLWGRSVSGHREWGIFASRNTKKIESKPCKPSCYQVWAPTSKFNCPTYRPLFSMTPR